MSEQAEERTVSQKLDLAIATVERLRDVSESEAREKALAKWRGIKARLEQLAEKGRGDG